MELSLRSDRRAAERGLSVIEVLVAAAILLVIALGLLPLFTRSMNMNMQGNESTVAANLAKSEVEELMQLAIDHPRLTVVGGNELVTTEYFSHDNQAWDAIMPTAPDYSEWIRTITVRQYQSVSDGPPNGPLPAGTSPDFIHLKEIVVRVQNARQAGPLGQGKEITVRTFKAS